MSKSHQQEAQNVHSASVCSKVKIAISFYLSQACHHATSQAVTQATSRQQPTRLGANPSYNCAHSSQLCHKRRAHVAQRGDNPREYSSGDQREVCRWARLNVSCISPLLQEQEG